MAFELKEGQGTLFKNDYKKSDNHPDYRGSLFINGKLMDVAAWVKEGKNGKFFSLAVEEHRERTQQSNPAPAPAPLPAPQQADNYFEPEPDDLPW